MIKYEYIENNPTSWQVFTPPPKDAAFERELITIAGKTGDKPNLRVVWGGTEKDDRTEHRNQLKYHCGYTVPKTFGFNYLENGEMFFTEDIETIPPHILGVVPVTKRQALGLPRWVIERYASPHHLEAQGRFQQRKGENDFTVLRDFPREGLYETWLIVEDRNFKYRDLGQDVLQFIKEKWQFEQLPAIEQERLYSEFIEKKAQNAEYRKMEAWMGAFDSAIPLYKDEREREAFLDVKLAEDLEFERKHENSVSVYYSEK